MVPCLIYSGGKDANAVSVEAAVLQKAISLPHVIQLDVDGKTKNVLTQEAQWDYLANTLLHVDFKEIRMDRKITTSVPLAVVGESKGVAAGGTLDQMMFEIEVECLPSNIPEKVEVDVSDLDIGDSITISNAPMPEGVVGATLVSLELAWSCSQRSAFSHSATIAAWACSRGRSRMARACSRFTAPQPLG